MSDDDGVLDLTELEDDDDVQVQKTAASSSSAGDGRDVNPTPPKYRASDTHRETLKLLSSISPSAVKVPSILETKRAVKELLEGSSALDLDDVDDIQQRLEVAMDTDLTSRRDLIESEVDKFKEAKRPAASSQEDEEVPLSQMSMDDGGSRAEDGGTGSKKRKRAGGKGFAASLPLVLPKGVGTGKVRTVLVQVDDKRQHLEGDSGAVGRVHTRGGDIILDIKGHEYKAQLVRAPALLMVSMGDEEAKVEEVFENLCLLTHHQDHLEHLGGKILKGEEFGRGGSAGSDDEYDEYRSGSEEEGGKGKKGKAAEKKKKKGGGAAAGGAGGGKGGGGVVAGKSKPSRARSSGGGKKTPAKKKGGGGKAGAKKKKSSTPSRAKSVSIGELKKRAKKQQEEEDDEEEEEEEEEEEVGDDDDDDDSDFSG